MDLLKLITAAGIDQPLYAVIGIDVTRHDFADDQRAVAGAVFSNEFALQIDYRIAQERRIDQAGRNKFQTGFQTFVAVVAVDGAEKQRFAGHAFGGKGQDKLFLFADKLQSVRRVIDPDHVHDRIVRNDRHPADGHYVDLTGFAFGNAQDYLFGVFAEPCVIYIGWFLHKNRSLK